MFWKDGLRITNERIYAVGFLFLCICGGLALFQMPQGLKHSVDTRLTPFLDQKTEEMDQALNDLRELRQEYDIHRHKGMFGGIK